MQRLTMKRSTLKRLTRFVGVFTLTISCISYGAKIEVKVENIKSNEGKIGCALFNSADGFPMSENKLQQLWLEADSAGVSCTFETVNDGSYAVAISHDLNDNQQTDTNFFGIPTEDWGVSNNIRPSMRAPTFDEAKFDVAGNTQLIVSID